MSEGSAASRARAEGGVGGSHSREAHERSHGRGHRRGARPELDDARENANVRDAIEGFDVESRKSKDLAERERASRASVRLEPSTRRAVLRRRCGRRPLQASDFPGYAPILQDMFALEKRGGCDDAARRLQCCHATTSTARWTPLSAA